MSKDKKAEIDKWANRIWKDHRRNGLLLHFDQAISLAPQVIDTYKASKSTGDCGAIRKAEALASVRSSSTSVRKSRSKCKRWQHGFGS